MWKSRRVLEWGRSVYSQRVYSTRPLPSTVGLQSWSWSKQSLRAPVPSAFMTHRLATLSLPATQGMPW